MSLPENDPPIRTPSGDGPPEPENAFPPGPSGGTPLGQQLGAVSEPGELRTSSYWVHFIVFLVFAFGSLIVLQAIAAAYLSAERHLSMAKLEKLMMSDASIIVAVQVAWFALILLFLYMTLGVLPGKPFWKTVGWRPFEPGQSSARSRALLFFFSGSALAIFVAVAGSRVSPKQHMPIEELFKDRRGVLLVMSMAVIVAPLVEETLFRGYLYPLFARTFGIPVGIVLTGILFGLLHGYQLGWAWGLVGLLTMVGIVFTYVRARTGTVFSSYLMHLGYNSLIALSTVVATKGLKHL